MRMMPVVVGMLGVVLGAGVVYTFREPVKRKKAPAPEDTRVTGFTELPSSSARVALPTNDGGPVQREILDAQAKKGVDPRWVEQNNAAIEQMNAGALFKAVELLEQCHAAVPGDAIFTSNLAEALARLSTSEFDRGNDADRARAIEHMTRAVALAPERQLLAKRLAQMRQLENSEQGMWRDETEHFVLSYDGDRGDLLGGSSALTVPLEAAYQQFGELFGKYPVEAGRSKIRVVLYRRDEFHQTTGIGHWAGGLYDGAVRVPVEDLRREKAQLVRVLRHELAHAFVHEIGGRDVPGWLNEGLAQRLECESMAEAQTMLENARRSLAGVAPLPFAALTGSLGAGKDEATIAQAYRQSLALVGWIERQYGDRVPYEMVAGHARDGAAAAFARRTGLSFEDAYALFLQSL